PRAPIHLDIDSVLTDNQELTAMIGAIAAACSILESRVALTLSELMGTKAHFGVAVYTAITSNPTREAVVSAVARKALSGRRLELLQALFELARKAIAARNVL